MSKKKLVNTNVMEFIITYEKPHKPVSTDTISRWIKYEFGKSGINTTFIQHTAAEQPQQEKQGTMALE